LARTHCSAFVSSHSFFPPTDFSQSVFLLTACYLSAELCPTPLVFSFFPFIPACFAQPSPVSRAPLFPDWELLSPDQSPFLTQPFYTFARISRSPCTEPPGINVDRPTSFFCPAHFFWAQVAPPLHPYVPPKVFVRPPFFGLPLVPFRRSFFSRSRFFPQTLVYRVALRVFTSFPLFHTPRTPYFSCSSQELVCRVSQCCCPRSRLFSRTREFPLSLPHNSSSMQPLSFHHVTRGHVFSPLNPPSWSDFCPFSSSLIFFRPLAYCVIPLPPFSSSFVAPPFVSSLIFPLCFFGFFVSGQSPPLKVCLSSPLRVTLVSTPLTSFPPPFPRCTFFRLPFLLTRSVRCPPRAPPPILCGLVPFFSKLATLLFFCCLLSTFHFRTPQKSAAVFQTAFLEVVVFSPPKGSVFFYQLYASTSHSILLSIDTILLHFHCCPFLALFFAFLPPDVRCFYSLAFLLLAHRDQPVIMRFEPLRIWRFRSLSHTRNTNGLSIACRDPFTTVPPPLDLTLCKKGLVGMCVPCFFFLPTRKLN